MAKKLTTSEINAITTTVIEKINSLSQQVTSKDRELCNKTTKQWLDLEHKINQLTNAQNKLEKEMEAKGYCLKYEKGVRQFVLNTFSHPNVSAIRNELILKNIGGNVDVDKLINELVDKFQPKKNR